MGSFDGWNIMELLALWKLKLA